MIIGRNLLNQLENHLLFDTQMMEWDKASTPMQDLDQFDQEDTMAKLKHKLLYMHDQIPLKLKGYKRFWILSTSRLT